jgi:DNA-binding response OmpR family regulator
MMGGHHRILVVEDNPETVGKLADSLVSNGYQVDVAANDDDYLVKPFSFVELLARVKALGRPSDTVVKKTVLRIRDLAMDCVANRQPSRKGLLTSSRRHAKLGPSSVRGDRRWPCLET